MSGVFLILLVGLAISVRDIYASRILQSLQFWSVPFWIYAISFLFVICLNVRGVKTAFLKSFESRYFKRILMLNIYSCAAFGGVLFALKWLQPSVLDALALTGGPLFALLARGGSKQAKALSMAMIGVSGLLVWFYVKRNGAPEISDIKTLLYALGGVVLASAGLTNQNIVVGELLSKGWKHLDILQMRYILLIIVSFVGSLAVDHSAPQVPELSGMGGFVAMALFGNLLPLYLINKGVELIGPLSVAFLMPVKLLLTFMLEQTDARFPFDSQIFLGVSVIAGLSLWGAVMAHNARKLAEASRKAA